MSTAFLSNRVLGIEPSPSIAANALVTELRAQGRDIVNFTLGEPDFDTPEHILRAAVTHITQPPTEHWLCVRRSA
jgi:aspartate aminotransferase